MQMRRPVYLIGSQTPISYVSLCAVCFSAANHVSPAATDGQSSTAAAATTATTTAAATTTTAAAAAAEWPSAAWRPVWRAAAVAGVVANGRHERHGDESQCDQYVGHEHDGHGQQHGGRAGHERHDNDQHERRQRGQFPADDGPRRNVFDGYASGGGPAPTAHIAAIYNFP